MHTNKSLRQAGVLVIILIGMLVPKSGRAQKDFKTVIEESGKYGLQMKKDKKIITLVKPKYDAVVVLSGLWEEPFIAAYKSKGKWGLLSIESGKVIKVTKPEYDKIHLLGSNEIAYIDLSGDYFLVWKAGKQALLSYRRYKGEDCNVGLWYDEISIDTVKFSKNYERIFYTRLGNKYGAGNLMKQEILLTEYDSFQTFESGDRALIHVLKKGNGYTLVIDKDKFWDYKVFNAEKVWFNKHLHWVSGKDTSVYYIYLGIMSVAEYRTLKAKHDYDRKKYEEEGNRKEAIRQAKLYRSQAAWDQPCSKKDKFWLEDHRTVYVFVDTFGVKCFDADSGRYIYSGIKMVHYTKSSNKLFLKSDKGEWYYYPYSYPYKNVKLIGNMFACNSSGNKWTVMGLKNYNFNLEEGSEIEDAWEVNFSINVIFKNKQGKYGFVSYHNDGGLLKYLPAGFDRITFISAYDGNPRIAMELNGETFNAYHDDIKSSYGSYSVKADMYGAKCGNPDCKNGILGYTTETIKGKTTTKTYNNTAVWDNGHYRVANVTVTETTPDTTRKEAKNCTASVHSVKFVGLSWNSEKGVYTVEKY